MRTASRLLALVAVSVFLVGAVQAAPSSNEESLKPVAPGRHGGQPFWNRFALRFIYPPAFDFAEVDGAKSYRFVVVGADGESHEFTPERPDADLSPVWAKVPEGVTKVSVQGIGQAGKRVGAPQE